MERCSDLIAPLDPQKPDHQLIAYAKKQHLQDSARFCAILSNDKELCDIAGALTVIAVSRHSDHRFHNELLRKYEWWEKANTVERTASSLVKPAQKARPQISYINQQIQLVRSVKKLYRRIDASGCRTTIYLAPVKARQALTLEVINRLRNPDRQVVIVVVENRTAAQFWAGELRQMGNFPPSKLQIFGIDPAERLDQAKAVIYCHDQIARRFPQHVSRLNHAQKRITAVVDGCDLLDPVELAILLYECDQFIGLSHLPLGYRHTRGHRMLNIVLHNRSLMDYTFADAERDGWNHSFDLYLSEIQFTSDERQIWNEINTDYLRLRNRAIKEFPELGESEDFWETLERMLENIARPDLADLIKQREQLEQMAQIGKNKLERIKQLLQSVPKHPYRRLLFDYTRQWTPVLLNQLNQAGIKVAELPLDENQRQIWDQFAGDRLDTLLLSDVPTFEMPGAHFHQLIILTPLQPMEEVLAMIDWSLSHTQTTAALRLDLLYVADTPEKIAMMALAEASFDLQYS